MQIHALNPSPLPSSKPLLVPLPLRSMKNNGSTKVTIPYEKLAFYYDTPCPDKEELDFAKRFFACKSPALLFSSLKFRTVHFTDVPEVAFLGRSNVGKSSLLNALLGAEICHTSKTPGRTRTMNAFAVGGEDPVGNKGRLTILDMPGYGFGSHTNWGGEIIKYLTQRKELRRVFVLIDSTHGMKKTDEQLLTLLRHRAIPHQVILSKVDRMLQQHKNPEKGLAALQALADQTLETVQPAKDGPPAVGEIICCSSGAAKLRDHKKLGIETLRHAVLAATGLNKLGMHKRVKIKPDADDST